MKSDKSTTYDKLRAAAIIGTGVAVYGSWKSMASVGEVVSRGGKCHDLDIDTNIRDYAFVVSRGCPATAGSRPACSARKGI
jgi:hypothetical protein